MQRGERFDVDTPVVKCRKPSSVLPLVRLPHFTLIQGGRGQFGVREYTEPFLEAEDGMAVTKYILPSAKLSGIKRPRTNTRSVRSINVIENYNRKGLGIEIDL